MFYVKIRLKKAIHNTITKYWYTWHKTFVNIVSSVFIMCIMIGITIWLNIIISTLLNWLFIPLDIITFITCLVESIKTYWREYNENIYGSHYR